METELSKLQFYYRKPIKIEITRQECVFVAQYLFEKSQLLRFDDLTELLVFDKMVELLKKLSKRIQSYTKVRSISISYTQAIAMKYLYEQFCCYDEPLGVLDFMRVYIQIDSKL